MRSVISAIFLSALAGPAMAAAATAKGPCEYPPNQAEIKTVVKQMRVEDSGYGLSTYGVYIDDVSDFRTISVTKAKLVCAVKLKVSAGGQVDYLRARVTLRQMKGDMMRAELDLE